MDYLGHSNWRSICITHPLKRLTAQQAVVLRYWVTRLKVGVLELVSTETENEPPVTSHLKPN